MRIDLANCKNERTQIAVTEACDTLKGNRRLNAVSRISHARLVAAALNLRTDLDKKENETLFRLWENANLSAPAPLSVVAAPAAPMS